MKYKIEISEEVESQDQKYPNYKEIYSQISDDINLLEVIKAFNGFKNNE